MPQDIVERLQAALQGRYRVQEQLGAGGMAVVYLADDLRHDRPVALKVIRPELVQAVGTGRFHREIRVTASLSHPNIPPLLDSGEADGLLYYVMPYLEAANLQARLKAEGRLALEEALRIARDVADALDYAHRVGLVHRDVKPSNVFLEEGHALLGDFGIALPQETETARITSAETVLGTAEYMSPEQCTGAHEVDGRSDLYSLGCLLYEMLAGEPPFVGRSRMAVVARQVSEPAPAVTVFRPDLPQEVDAIVRRCLAKAPGDRYPTAGALREDLEEALALVKQRTAGTGRGAPRPKRKRALVGSLVLTLALLVFFLVLWPGSAPALSPTHVVVFPLADRGAGSLGGSDVAIVIGNALVQAEPLTWIDGWEWLPPEKRADPSLVSAEERRAIALARGARYYLTGSVTSAGDSLSVRLVLHDARDDTVVLPVVSSDLVSRATPPQLGLRAVVQLLPELVDPGRAVDVSFLQERSPQSVSLWMAGDAAYREARFQDALGFYQASLAEDSLMAWAALKGAMAASWIYDSELVERLLDVAMRHDTLLPSRHRAFARGLAAYHDERPGPAVAAYREALALEPRWAEAWTGLGETYRHLLPPDLGAADSARVAFQRALESDPDFATPLIHLAEFAYQRGDLARGGELVARLEAARGEPVESLTELWLMQECARTSVAGAPGTYPPEVLDPMPLLNAAWLFSAGARNPACAEVGFRRILSQPSLDRGIRWAAVMGLQGLMVAEARWDELEVLLAEEIRRDGNVNFLFGTDVRAGAPLEVEAARADSIVAANFGYDGVGPATAWVLANWHAHLGNVETLRVLESRLAALAEERDDDRTRRLWRAAQGHLALATGDSARARERFAGLETPGSRRTLGTAYADPFAPERLLLAELLLADGQPREAHRVASLFDHTEPLIFIPFIARSLSVRLRAARAVPGAEWARLAQEAEDRLRVLGRSDLLPREQGGSP